MRASSFEDYLIYHEHGFVPHNDEPFLGLEPDGFFGEAGLSGKFYLTWDDDELSEIE
jgi:hypothetical protein